MKYLHLLICDNDKRDIYIKLDTRDNDRRYICIEYYETCDISIDIYLLMTRVISVLIYTF